MSSVALITNNLPALSGTFIYKEVLGLKKRGLSIKTYSVWKPKITDISKESHELFNSTTYLLPLNIFKFIKSHGYFFFTKPLKYIKILIFLMTRKYDNKSYETLREERMFKSDRVRTFIHFCEGVYFAKFISDNSDFVHIHAHYANQSTSLAMVASMLTGIPFSFTAHAYDIWLDNLFIEEKANAAKFVITCSEYGKSEILKNNSITEPQKISTIYHGVDTEKFKPKNNIHSHSKLTIMTVGRLSEEKAQKDLIMACKILKEEGYDFQCNIVGDGPLYEYLKQLIGEMKLEGIVELCGRVFQENIRDYYERSDIFVLTSIQENLANVLLECLSMGVPAVATNVGGIPELIKDGVTGILVYPNDIEGLSEAIKLLLTNHELRKEIGENGRRYVCEKFDSERCLDQLIKIYHENGISRQNKTIL